MAGLALRVLARPALSAPRRLASSARVALLLDESGSGEFREWACEWGTRPLEGIAVRDRELFSSEPYCAPPATLVVRGGALVVRTHALRALVRERQCAIFLDASRGAARSAAEAVRRRLQEQAGAHGPGRPAGPADPADPAGPAEAQTYALVVLEVLLEESGRRFEQKLRRVQSLVDHTLKGVNSAVGDGNGDAGEEFARLVPLKRALKALDEDVKEGHQMAEEALTPMPEGRGGDGAGGALVHHPALGGAGSTSAVLHAYLRRTRAIAGQLRELREELREQQALWELLLDDQRNRMNRLNLVMSAAVLALTTAAVPFGALGMNLPHGLEAADVTVFWGLCGGLGAWSATLFCGCLWWLRHGGPAARRGEHSRNLHALQDVLALLDEVDDIGDAADGGISRADFERVLTTACPPNRVVDPAAAALVFNALDANSDGSLDAAEWARR